ncbi:MAG: gamma carbonic anhydrase family protein [Alphaproteobacteria bacterium]
MPLYELDGRVPALPGADDVWIAPDAQVIGDVRLASGTSLWFGCVLRGDMEPITIGESSNLQELCVGHTDPGYALTVGAGCTIGHRVILHGCTIGNNTLVGMGAIILNGATIGRDCLIGAGALVPESKSIPDGSLVVGLPGRVVRPLSEEEIAGNRASARSYHNNARRFATGLRAL